MMKVNGILVLVAGLFLAGIDGQDIQPSPTPEGVSNTTTKKIDPPPSPTPEGVLNSTIPEDHDMCQYTNCHHGGQCMRNNGHEYCNCTDTGFTGPLCELQNGHEMCQYTDCHHGGQCMRYNGYEYCNCTGTGFAGLLCELRNGSCTDYPCENNATCTNGTSGERYCTCLPYYTGVDCDDYDSDEKCAEIPSDDLMFLPKCSLKTSLAKLSGCINEQLPYLSDSGSECVARITRTTHCIYKVVSDCSNVACDSAFLYGGLQIYDEIAKGLYNPLSNFSMALTQLLCSGPVNGSFQLPDHPFNIGAPVCGADLLDQLVKTMVDYSNSYFKHGTESVCSKLATWKGQIYNITKASCDWSKIGEAFPTIASEYFQEVLEMSHEYFLEWFVPGCEPSRCTGYCLNGGYCNETFGYLNCACTPGWSGERCDVFDHGGTSGACPMISSTSSRCELQDAWMCQHFNYRKMLSSWMQDYMLWWRGCSGFAERNWNHWASSMGLNRGYGSGHHEEGFNTMIRANMPCNDNYYSSMDCFQGEEFYDTLGCRHCFRQGTTGRNSRSLLMMWMQEQQQHAILTKIYNALRQECSGLSTGCAGTESTSTLPPVFTGFESTVTSSMFSTTSSSGGSTTPPASITPHSPPSTSTTHHSSPSASTTPHSTPSTID